MPTWEEVVASATRFPGVEVSTSFGTPSIKVGKRFLGRLRSDPDALVLKTTDMQEREALLAGQPEVFFTIPHYDGYPAVLIHLDRIAPELLAELVEDAWRTYALKKHLAAHAAAGCL